MVTNGMSVASDRSPSGPRAMTRGRLGEDVRGELRGDVELAPQVVQTVPDQDVDSRLLRLLRRAGVQLDVASGHAASLGGPGRRRAAAGRVHPDANG